MTLMLVGLTKGAGDVRKAMAVQYGDTSVGEESRQQENGHSQNNNETGVAVQQMPVPVLRCDLHGCCSKEPPCEEDLHSGSYPTLKQSSVQSVLPLAKKPFILTFYSVTPKNMLQFSTS
jgi:hypothetical protein